MTKHSSWSDDLQRDLEGGFPETDISWVAIATINKNKPDQKEGWAPYLEVHVIRERLSASVVAGGWSSILRPVPGQLAVICELTILGTTRCGMGEAEDKGDKGGAPPMKTAATDAFKRAAAEFGIGSYLSRVDKVWTKTGDPTPDKRRGKATTANAPAARSPAPSPVAPAPAAPAAGPAAEPAKANGLTPGQQAFQDMLKAHDLDLERAVAMLCPSVDLTPKQAIFDYITEIRARKDCDADKAWRMAADALSEKAGEKALAS